MGDALELEMEEGFRSTIRSGMEEKRGMGLEFQACLMEEHDASRRLGRLLRLGKAKGCRQNYSHHKFPDGAS